MINIKPIIFNELKKVCKNVNDTYPSNWATFPIIQYIEEDNRTTLKTDDKEQQAYIRYKIDIWNDRSTSDIAVAVDGVLSLLGLERIQCLDAPDPKQLKHKVMRYEGIIDVNNMRVYSAKG
ncbi:hypothetical protein CP118TE_12980 [Clostridium perfringens E]|uniref:hypothetical protein n=1 Tax=Clostridium perfringens TaxID=1502 RepID=UPI001A26D79A|nr:hypothetical protein [Clostridium perfringens]WCM71350.1 hypothetical protein LZD60_08225 [Clostridium perfringens]BDC01589.1 hypothetical protein CP118TE_12980 [Clostridium perfringens E]HAT4312903.1 hypothetical protein [Clostridium perfringens]